MTKERVKTRPRYGAFDSKQGLVFLTHRPSRSLGPVSAERSWEEALEL